MLKVTVATRPGGVTLVLRGELDSYASQELERTLDPLLSKLGQDLVLDITDVSYMNSSGLRAFIRTEKRLQERGLRLVLKGVNPRVQSVFSYCGLDTFFQFDPPLRDPSTI